MEEDQQANNPASENEIADYYEGVKKMELEDYQRGIKKARNVLFVTAVLIFIGEMISAGASQAGITPLVIGIALIESGIFVGLGFWTKTKPYTAIIVGLIIFILIWIVAITVLGLRGAYSGILVRIIVISYLVSALKPARAFEEMKKSG